MGQKIKYNPDEWDIDEFDHISSSDIISDTSDEHSSENTSVVQWLEDLTTNKKRTGISLKLDELDKPLEVDAEPMSSAKKLIEEFDQELALAAETDEPLSQEEEAFRRQIEDLFELLELEKEADKEDGIRVYQTDSSPSRPWRFH